MKIIITVFTLIVLSACASRPDSKDIVNVVPDCGNAQEQINMLDEEMIEVHDKIIAGARTVLPSAALVSLVSGSWSTNRDIATGEYERLIEDKIKEIMNTCEVKSTMVK